MPDGGDQYVTFSAAWFTLSLINAGLAQSKGRSGLNWWFASLFVGPLATLLIVAWPRVDSAADEGSRRDDGWGMGVLIGVGLLVIGLVIFLIVRLAGG